LGGVKIQKTTKNLTGGNISVPDAFGKAYNRTKFLDDLRHIIQSWADYLDDLKAANFAKVVPFDRTAG